MAVLIQPVDLEGKIGVLVGKRGIEPSLGRYGLPGGHVEFGERLEPAAVRELMEEMNISVSETDIAFSHSYADNIGHLLSFFRGRTIPYAVVMRDFAPSHECTDMRVVFEPEELAFKSHTEALWSFFNGSGHHQKVS